jgi:flagellar hook-associated protein 3 FlgL
MTTINTLSTLGQSNLIRSEFGNLQTDIQKLQSQIASGQKSDRLGDLGSQAPLDISLRNNTNVIDNFNSNIESLNIRTNVVDKSLNNIHDLAQTLQNLAFQSPTTDEARANLVSTARSTIDQVIQQLQASVDGRQLFGGVQTQTNPMVASTTLFPTVQTAVNAAVAGLPANVPAAIQAAVAGIFATTANFYQGGVAHSPSQIDVGLTVDYSITGGDPAFQSIFQGLYTIAALPQPVAPPATPPNITQADFDTAAQTAASQIATGISQLETLIEKNGRNQKLLTDTQSAHKGTLTVLSTQIDNIETVDIADATTRLTQLRTQLQASFSITADLKDLSLINFLK